MAKGVERVEAPQWWSVQRVLTNEVVYIIGGGPSLRGFDFSPLATRWVIGCNDAYRLGWPLVDICLFGDYDWFTIHNRQQVLGTCQHTSELAAFTGLTYYYGLTVAVVEESRARHLPKWVLQLQRVSGTYGIEPTDPSRPSRIRWNRSTGASAINLAWHLGARRVVLLGFDMHNDVAGVGNWHVNLKNRAPTPQQFQSQMYPFTTIARDAKALGLQIFNATPGSALDMFPIIDPVKAVNGILEE